MKCVRTLSALLMTLSLVWSIPLETTSSRLTTRSIEQPVQHINDKLMDLNSSTFNIVDVRTPPKIQQEVKQKLAKPHFEASHAGVAIPVEADIGELEETTKKLNFYKIERPFITSTEKSGGLSTWILLSGQPESTTVKVTTKKPSVKPVILKEDANQTLVVAEKPVKIVKPIFKPRSTTPRSAATTTSKTTTVKINGFSPKITTSRPTKLTKVRASLLKKANSTSILRNNSSNITVTTTTLVTTTKPALRNPTTSTKTTLPATKVTSNSTSSSVLPVEAKDGDSELPSDEKKKKTNKRKKNKNKKRKPEKASKEGTNNKLKDISPMGTQLYSYLRSEIIPVTVGVSLVGLLVTAGLASYYLQPFAALRRSDPIDRKDTDGGYYYQDQYSGGVPEEEAIGKVIAGMPDNALQSDGYKTPTSRNTYPTNVRYRHIDRRSQIYMNPYGSVEDVKLNNRAEYAGTSYNQENNQFVVGSVPQDVIQEVTPAVVPEHGPRNLNVEEKKFVVGNIPKEFFSGGPSPRNLKIRRRRQVVPDDIENEISPEENEVNSNLNVVPFNPPTTLYFSSTDRLENQTGGSTESSHEEEPTTLNDITTVVQDTTHHIMTASNTPFSFMDLLKDIFRLKARLGLELIQNVTRGVSDYVTKVQSRLDQHYRNSSSSKT